MLGLSRAVAVAALGLAVGFGGAVRTATFTWVALLVLSAVLAWLVAVVRTGELVVARRRIDPVLLALFMVAAISAGRSINPWVSRLELHRFGLYLLYWLLCSQLLTTRRDVRHAAGLVVVLGVAVIGAGLLGVRPTAPEFAEFHGTTRMRSTFVSPNHFAGFVAMPTLVATGLAFAARGSQRVLLIGLAMFGLVAVSQSMSRGGLVSLVAGIVFLLASFVMAGRGRSVLAATIAMALAAVVGYGVTPAPARARLATVLDPESATAHRRELWSAATELVAERPFLGFGPGTFRERFPSVQPERGEREVRRAHSDYLELTVETGLVGLAVAATGLGLLLAGTVPLVRRSADTTQAAGLGALAGCVAALVQAIAEFNFRSPANVLLFVACAAIASAAAESPWRTPKRWVRLDCHGSNGWLLGGLAVAALTLATVELTRPYRSARLRDAARSAMVAGHYDEAESALARARAIAPNDFAVAAEIAGLERTRALDPQHRDLGLQRMAVALTLYQQIVDLAPHHADYRRSLAHTLASAGRNDDAARVLLEMIELRPNDPWAQLEVGIFFDRALGRRAEALTYIRRAVAIDPMNLLASAIDVLGPDVDPLQLIPQTTAGHEALARYIREQTDPARLDPRLAATNLGRAYELAPTPENAVRHMHLLTTMTAPELTAGLIADRYVAAYPQDVAVHREAAALAGRMGDRARRFGFTRGLVELEPAEASHRVNLGRVLHELDRLADAEAEIRRALQLDPRSALAWFELGLLAQSQDVHTLASEHFERAVALAPNVGRYRLRLAEELHHAGRDDEAIRQLEECMTTDATALERCRQLYGLYQRPAPASN